MIWHILCLDISPLGIVALKGKGSGMNINHFEIAENHINMTSLADQIYRWMRLRQESLFLSVLEEISGTMVDSLNDTPSLPKGESLFQHGHYTTSSSAWRSGERQNTHKRSQEIVSEMEKSFRTLYEDVGRVSALFESGNAPGAIGYDPKGGTSYGTYQISSRQGTMDEFLIYLDRIKPGWAKRLRNAGPSDTGSTQGRFPQEWRAIAENHPDEFAEIQHAFIRENFFEPVRDAIRKRFNWDIDSAPEAVKEAIWSTAVQHGVHGCVQLVDKALSRNSIEGERSFIKMLYSLRATQFNGLSQETRKGVLSRLEREEHLLSSVLNQNTESIFKRIA